MAGFLYFAAGYTNPITDEALAKLNLAYAFERSPMFGVLTSRTPSGGPGTILADGDKLPNGDLAYRPDQQTWRKRPGDDVWVGMWNDHHPAPDDLARDNQLSGATVELADGSRWRMPRLVWHAGEDGFQLALPTYYDLDENGKWICGAVDEGYTHLNDLADRLHAGIYLSEMEGGERLTTEELLDAVPRLLAVNYRLSHVECAMLRLFKRGGGLRRAAEVAVDYDTAMDWLEKKSAAVGAG